MRGMTGNDNSLGGTEEPNQQLIEKLRRIEKRDWWIWGYALLVILLLTGAVFSLALPSMLQGANALLKVRLKDAVFGLACAITLFNAYIVYQQILIKRLRRQLAENYDHSRLLRNLAMIDPLTGLYNRRAGEQRLVAEVARCSRKGDPLTILLLDLNKFKQINDTLGHAAGDHVLKEFGAALRKAIRGSDVAVRTGGDEFLVVLPDCRADQVQHVLARLAAFNVEWQGQKKMVTVSAGWRQYEPGDQPAELLKAADDSLYENKRSHHEAHTDDSRAVR
jgi:diguanylate cyclase (GGDEF)-like protein